MLDSEGPHHVLWTSPIAISTSCQSNAQSGRLEMLSSSYMIRYACYMKSDAWCSPADPDVEQQSAPTAMRRGTPSKSPPSNLRVHGLVLSRSLLLPSSSRHKRLFDSNAQGFKVRSTRNDRLQPRASA